MNESARVSQALIISSVCTGSTSGIITNCGSTEYFFSNAVKYSSESLFFFPVILYQDNRHRIKMDPPEIINYLSGHLRLVLCKFGIKQRTALKGIFPEYTLAETVDREDCSLIEITERPGELPDSLSVSGIAGRQYW